MFDLLSKSDMVNTMDKTMIVASRRMGLVASNIANIDTPDYRTRDFPFHEVLKDVLDEKPGQALPMVRTHPRHMGSPDSTTLPYALDRAITKYERNDGNDVNLDSENMKLMQTQGTYSRAALFSQTGIRRILNAIREGGR